MWRAANGINPQDPRPTGGTQLETLPPSGNNASTGISRVPPTRQQMRGPTSDRQHAPHLVAPRRQATPVPKRRTASERAVRARPIAHLSRQIAALGNMRLHSTRRWQAGSTSAESGSCQIKAPRERGAAGAACPPPCGPCAGLLWTGRRHAGAPSGGCSSTRGLYSTSWMRPSKVRCSIISRATSG